MLQVCTFDKTPLNQLNVVCPDESEEEVADVSFACLYNRDDDPRSPVGRSGLVSLGLENQVTLVTFQNKLGL